MKIGLIVNNYGKSYDGIGAYAALMDQHFPKEIQIKVYSGFCKDSTMKALRFVQLGMMAAIAKATLNFQKDNVDLYLIEYPFMEWNPLILPMLFYLSAKAKRSSVSFVVSLHEYGRTSLLRRWVSKHICKMADVVLTTTSEVKSDIEGFCQRVEIRNLPSNIWDDESMIITIPKKRNCFVYFGRIVSSKAFNEMITAWDRFNADEVYSLYVISATRLDESFPTKHHGVHYLYDGDNATLIRLLRKCAYCFLPIRPEVDLKNSTFKTATVAGCICIGRFCESLKSMPFVVQMDDYQPDTFTHAINEVLSLSDEQIQSMIDASYNYGKQYNPSEAFSTLANLLQSIVSERKRSTGPLR